MRRSRSSALGLVLGVVACGGARGPGGGGGACPADPAIVLDSQDAVVRHAGCTRARSVTIRTAAPLDLAPLRALAEITGDLRVGPTMALEELRLLELREVGGSIEVASNASMRGVLLPRLARAGRIAIEANAALTTVSLPRLDTVRGSVLLTELGSLELVDLSALTTIAKDLVIAGNPRLALVEADRLARVLEVRVEDNRALPADQVEALAAKASVPTVGGPGTAPP